MLARLNKFIAQERLFSKGEKILLAVSGGVDSVVMCELFYQVKQTFAIAHCNFQLRGKESVQDELFVKSLAKKYKVPFYSVSFSTASFSKEKGISIQMAARELRYKWFEEIRRKNKYKSIATAHHQDDSIETFFINLIRGTGISGLHGILPKQNNIVRPLLFTTKAEIVDFTNENKLKYREDSSNSSDKYLRNKLRLKIIPELKKINPSIEQGISCSIAKIRGVEQIYLESIEEKRNEIITIKEGKIFISIKKLTLLNTAKTYLFEFLKPYNFNESTVNSILESLNGISGKRFYSSTHCVLRDREMLILTKRDQQTESFRLKYTVRNANRFKISVSRKTACLDYSKLNLPLKIRKWREGDFFYPLGMSKKKKLSDFLIDNKVSLTDKKNIQVLLSGKEIVWVIGMRIDERFKITEKTSKMYVCELVEE